MTTDDAVIVRLYFCLRLLDRATDHTCHNYPSVNQARNCGTCGVGQVIRATTQRCICEVDEVCLCGPKPSHWAQSSPNSG